MGRYKASEVDNERYYQLPKALFTNPVYKDVPLAAKTVYAVLKDRMALSRARGWKDENGDIYLLFRQHELMNILSLSERTTIRMLRVLQEANLIDVERQGFGKPNKIYIQHLFPEIPNCQNDNSRPAKNAVQYCQNGSSRSAKSSVHTYSETEISETYKSDDVVVVARAREKNNDDDLLQVLDECKDCICPNMTVFQKKKIEELHKQYGTEWTIEAIREASVRNGKSVKYIESILQNWARDGFKSKKGAKNHGTSGRHFEADSGTSSTPARSQTQSDLSDFERVTRDAERRAWGNSDNSLGR